jgi:uncharacterized protein
MTAGSELGWLLDDLVSRVPGVMKALVLSRDGLCFGASAELSSDDADRLAAMAASFHSLARGAVHELDGGDVHQVIVEMNSAFLFTTAAGEGACLAVVSSAQVDVGMVAYEMALLVRRVNRHLSVQSRGAVTSGGE